MNGQWTILTKVAHEENPQNRNECAWLIRFIAIAFFQCLE